MSKKFWALIAITLAVGVVESSAIRYQDVDDLRSRYLSANDPTIGTDDDFITGAFNIVTSADSPVTIGAPYGPPTVYSDITGYVPYSGLEAAWVWLYVRDDNDSAGERVRYRINFQNDDAIFTESDFSGGSSIVGGNIAITGDLTDDGALNYRIRALRGDFIVDFAALVASDSNLDPFDEGMLGGGTSPEGVPDGGSTMALMGLAMLGMSALRRKLYS